MAKNRFYSSIRRVGIFVLLYILPISSPLRAEWVDNLGDARQGSKYFHCGKGMTYPKKKWGLLEWEPQEYKEFQREYPGVIYGGVEYPDFLSALTNPQQFPDLEIVSGIFIGKPLSYYRGKPEVVTHLVERIIEPQFKKPEYLMQRSGSKSSTDKMSIVFEYTSVQNKNIYLKIDFLRNKVSQSSPRQYSLKSVYLQDSDSVTHKINPFSSSAPIARADCIGENLEISTAFPFFFDDKDGVENELPLVFVKFLFKVPLLDNQISIPAI